MFKRIMIVKRQRDSTRRLEEDIMKTREIEKFKDQLMAFKDILEKSGLAPASPIWTAFASFALLKDSQRLKHLTIALVVLTLVLTALTAWDIWLRLAD
jgi:hypothetical protein